MGKSFYEMVHQKPWSDNIRYKPTTVEIDRTVTLSMECRKDSTSSTRHIDLKYHHVLEILGHNIISLRKVDTNKQVAYLLTKPGTVTSTGRLVNSFGFDSVV